MKKLDAKAEAAAKAAAAVEGPRYEGRILDGLQGNEATIEALLRAAERGRFPSALIFAGPSGVGKRRAALGLAQALVCERSRRACGRCGPCARVAHGQSEGVRLVEPQGVAIKVEQAREILHFLSLQKLGRGRAVIVDQAQAMSPQGANALLKALEEPPPDAVFFLITHQPSALLPTIRSRAQSIRFAPLTSAQLSAALKSLGEEAPSGREIAASRGSVEEALRNRETADASAEARAAIAALLSSPRRSFPGDAIARVREAATDRPSALMAIRSLQEIARDLARKQAGFRAASLLDEALAVADAHPDVRMPQALALSEWAQQAEADVMGNVDRGLIFENLWLDWARALEEASA